MTDSSRPELLVLVAQVVAAHVSNTETDLGALPGLIHAVHAAFRRAGTAVEAAAAPERQPAVPVRKSVLPDHIVCLEDGQTMSTLKRHLRTSHNLTPEEYRQRWGLPHDYPMVAAHYSEYRSGLAKALGLGHRTAQPAASLEPGIQRVPEGVSGMKRGRKKAA